MRFTGAGVVIAMWVAGCGSAADGDTAVQPAVTAADTVSIQTAPPASSPVVEVTGYGAVDDAIAVIRFDGDRVDEPAPYFGSQNASGGPAAPVDGFVPASEDQEFCWAVEAINSRPQPRDEFQEIVVADGYFSAIRPFAVEAVVSELEVLIGFTNTIVSQGSFTETDEVDSGAIAVAFESINTFVDEHCLGIAPMTDVTTAVEECRLLFRVGDQVFDKVTTASPRYWSPATQVAYTETGSDTEPIYLLPLPTADTGPPLAEQSEVSIGSGETGVIGTIEGEPVARIAVSDERCPAVLIFGPASPDDLAVAVSKVSFSAG